MRARWGWLLAVSSCGLFANGPDPAERDPSMVCEAPADPTLLGIAPELRNEVMQAAGEGVVAVRYHAEGCTAELEVEAGCELGAPYRYAGAGGRRSTVIRDELELFLEMPLHAGGLTRALEEYGALRVDEEVVGRLLAPVGLHRERALLGDGCADATHLAVGIELGGASLVAGPMATISTDRNWFLRPTRAKNNPAALQYLGRVSTCRRARKKAARTPGCDHPLRVRLLPIIDQEQERDAGEDRKPAPIERRVEPETIAVAAGEFRMGKAKVSRGDGPQHSVQLKAFEIDRTEVTAAAYASCVAAGACTPAASGRFCTGGVPGKENHPINCVTWKQASAYCAFVKKRLPTEAEWERAARGTDARRFVWGNAWPPPQNAGNFADRSARESEPEWHAIEGYDDGHPHTAPAGAMAVGSPAGAADMAGNVGEWVADWYDARTYSRRKRTDPDGPKDGKARVVRGGSFGRADPEVLEVTHRLDYLEDFESAHIGFRCAR